MSKDILENRLRKAKFLAHLLSAVPFVKMVALTGSMARGEARQDSDIDFFIVTHSGRIWTSRFLAVLLLKILNQYRTEKNQAGKICPNRWQTEDSLEIYPKNPYHTREYSQIVPLFEIDSVYQKFLKANRWKGKNAQIIKQSWLSNFLKTVGEKILDGELGDFLEEKLKNYQKRRILWDKRTYKQRARIIISDQMLCFHPEAR